MVRSDRNGRFRKRKQKIGLDGRREEWASEGGRKVNEREKEIEKAARELRS